MCGAVVDKKTSIRNDKHSGIDVLEALIKDPTLSMRAIAKKLGSYRQKVWRDRRKLEDNNIVWGYTAVVDESRLDQVLYLVLLKTKPMSESLADLIVERIVKREPQKQQVRLLNLLYINGEYDWVLMFSAPNHAVARRYYDSLRLVYADYLLDKPVIVDVNFAVVREGKPNPEIKKMREFVPLM